MFNRRELHMHVQPRVAWMGRVVSRRTALEAL